MDRTLPSIGLPSASTTGQGQALANRRTTMARVRLNGMAFLISEVGAEDTGCRVSGLRGSAMRGGRSRTDHSPAWTLSGIDAGNAVAEGQHRQTSETLGLMAEIRDLSSGSRKIPRRGVHQPALSSRA